MTKQEFQKVYGEEHRKMLASPYGQAVIATMLSLRPPYEFSVQNHLLVENRGAIRGFDFGVKTFVSLATPINPPQEIEATYGVPDAPSKI